LQNDKIQAFFEQTKKDEEKRRKQDEYNIRVKVWCLENNFIG
jgi:hypothetical protein